MNRFKTIFVLGILFSMVAPLRSDEGTRRRLEASIRFLADDLLRGRGTPSRGLDIAARYLASELQAAGWEPANGESYLQTYELRAFTPDKAVYKISLNGIPLDRKDFIYLPFGVDPARTPVRYDLEFVGRGVVAPDRGVDELGDTDLTGKAAIALYGAPWELDPTAVHAYDRALGKSVQVSVRNSPCLIYVSEELASTAQTPPSAEAGFFREMDHAELAYLPEFKGKSTMGLGPILALTPAVFDRTLAEAVGGTYAELQKRLAEGTRKPEAVKASLEISIEVEPQKGTASNVVAKLPGSDPKLKDEWVVLTAHYDHLGFHAVAEGEDGIWNGADDNASGTSSVLEIARRLAQGKRPKRSVLVLLVSGEERGTVGSGHYSKHPLVPYEQVVININVDMVGRSEGSVQGIAPGGDEIFAKAVEIGRRYNITVEPDQNPSWRLIYFTDSYHFARFDRPFIFFFTGMHKDYHQPSDEPDRIRYEELGRFFEVMYRITEHYAEVGEKPRFKRPAWFTTPPE